MDKIERAYVIFTTMTRHHMALRIVEMEDDSAAAIEAVNTAREATAEVSAKFTEYNAKLAYYDKRINELQDALELAEEAVLAKQPPVAPEGWQLVPVELTDAMSDAIYKELGSPTDGWYGFDDSYRAMLAAAPKLGGE